MHEKCDHRLFELDHYIVLYFSQLYCVCTLTKGGEYQPIRYLPSLLIQFICTVCIAPCRI